MPIARHLPLLAAALILAERAGAQQSSPPGAVPPPARGYGEPRSAYDTTVLGIRRIGLAVAEAKVGMDALRRAGNEPGGVMVQRATLLRAKCRALATAAAQQGRVLCRSCLDPERQVPLDAYRAYLPTLQRVGQQCAASIARATTGRGVDAAAARLRRESAEISSRIIEGLLPYEERLAAVRVAFGWAPPPPSPVRRGD